MEIERFFSLTELLYRTIHMWNSTQHPEQISFHGGVAVSRSQNLGFTEHYDDVEKSKTILVFILILLYHINYHTHYCQYLYWHTTYDNFKQIAIHIDYSREQWVVVSFILVLSCCSTGKEEKGRRRRNKQQDRQRGTTTTTTKNSSITVPCQ